MATTTAIILIGKAHQYDSGINPTHLIQFTENDRPALILQTIEGESKKVVIIPTIENTIDDIYLMIAVFVLKAIKPSKKLNSITRKSLYDILDEEERKTLYKGTKDILIANRIKVVFNIFDNSHLLNLLNQIKKYPNDFEVTLPALKKELNIWNNKVIRKGKQI